jgi:hypothetical protein
MTLFEQVLSYIDAPDPACFESLALTVFWYEAEHVSIYRQYLDNLGIDPRTVRSLEDIPPVSTLAYKYARIENELHPLSPASRVFLTSGTSIGRDERGRHLVPEHEIYHASAIRHLQRMMFPDSARMRMLALHPTVDRMPESSLAQMISWCIDEFGEGDALCAATPQSVDTAQAIDYLSAAERLSHPVCILGTTASCAALFSVLRQNGIAIALQAGSRLMDTGGAKGQRIPLSPDQVIAAAHELLGIQPSLVINEYGMTEMCSQLYDATSFNSEFEGAPARRMKLAPPWLRPAALDPVTLKPAADGQPGLLAFFDLANAGSVSALITDDVGIVRGNAVMVLGRAAAADRRGCALAIEQFAQAVESSQQSRPRQVEGHNAPVIDVWAYAVQHEVAEPMHAPAASEIQGTAGRLRRTLATAPSSTEAEAIGAMLHEVMEAITGSHRWQRAIRRIAAKSGYSASLLSLSLRALVRPLHEAAELASKVRPRRELLGFIMPGNVPGAGLHELMTALAAGCAAIVKTSSSEPVFFSELAATLRELDSRFGTDFGARIEVFNWAREHTGLTDALLESCDRVIAFGDDATILQLQELAQNGRVIAFGSRFSGAAVMREAAQGLAIARTAEALALDCAMFDQRGCLSPHHIFVEQHAREFAVQLAAAFSKLDSLFGGNGAPRKLELEDAAAIRRARETARWRMLGGASVELWEDRNFQWTVVFDEAASFTPSPGFCTVYVSPFSNPADLERRLGPVHGRLEGFVITACEPAVRESISSLRINRFSEPAGSQAVREIVKRCGATYICPPGEMQSPPLDWPHGSGEFIRLFIG